MKTIYGYIFFLVGLLLFVGATRADTLTWTLPTERVNGQPIEAVDAVELYRNGNLTHTVVGSATSFDIAETCQAASWTAVAVLDGLSSDPSAAVTQSIDEVGCRPKPVTGLSF